MFALNIACAVPVIERPSYTMPKPRAMLRGLMAQKDLEQMKKHLNEYHRMVEMQSEIQKLTDKSEALTAKIELARELPGQILQTAKIPVEGLTVKDGIPLIDRGNGPLPISKSDVVLCVGKISTREHEGKTYKTLVCGLVISMSRSVEAMSSQSANSPLPHDFEEILSDDGVPF